MTTESKLQKPDNNSDRQPEKEQFQWTKQWYPVATIEFLDPTRPHAMQLLGKDIVLWRDNTGKWNCFADVCPHRLVPLSEGRIESDGTLLCAYHAWRFDSQGKCVSIPQSKDKEIEAKNFANPRSCAVVYPSQERQGLLWVWGEPGEKAQVESKLKKPRIIPELEEKSDRVVKTTWSHRDLPYGWELFMENICDPAHVPVSHHGIMGSRYGDDKYYDMLPLREMSTEDGFAYEITPVPGNVKQAVHDFQPPCHMRIYSEPQDGGKFILALYATPTRPGWCRTIGCQVFVKNDRGKIPKGLAFFALPMPVWLSHVLGSLFVHQDLVFLHYQERILKKQKNRWLEAVYTPNPQDKMTIALRQWLAKRAGGEVPWSEECDSNLPPAELDKRKLFDTWTMHTKDCTTCQDALKNINRLTRLSFAGAILALFIAIFLDSRSIAIAVASKQIDLTSSIFSVNPGIGFWLSLLGAILLTAIGLSLGKLSKLFYIYEFSHSDND